MHVGDLLEFENTSDVDVERTRGDQLVELGFRTTNRIERGDAQARRCVGRSLRDADYDRRLITSRIFSALKQST